MRGYFQTYLKTFFLRFYLFFFFLIYDTLLTVKSIVTGSENYENMHMRPAVVDLSMGWGGGRGIYFIFFYLEQYFDDCMNNVDAETLNENEWC